LPAKMINYSRVIPNTQQGRSILQLDIAGQVID
jgi:hypothetical protein